MSALLIEDHSIDTPRGTLFAQSWQPAGETKAPLILLHDSLGCVSLWRDFPQRLAQATGRRVIAYDRLGFGRSSPHPSRLPVTFVEDEAVIDFGIVCRQLGLHRYVVVGHSVGGGMAVGCAAAHPQACVGVITISAQAMVDDDVRNGIRKAQALFADPEQRERLGKYHSDKTGWVLQAWIETWLSEAFSQWRLDDVLPKVRCPLLSLHGDRDEYASALHPARLVELAAGPSILHLLKDCGHVPHREQADEVLSAISTFLTRHVP